MKSVKIVYFTMQIAFVAQGNVSVRVAPMTCAYFPCLSTWVLSLMAC